MLLTIAIASVSSIAVLALVARATRLRRIRQQLQRPPQDLPSELRESWSKSRVWQFASENAVVGGAVAFNTGQALFHFQRMDDRVFDAIDTIYQPGAENSFSEIVDHLREQAAGSDSAWGGAVAAYKGRLGEDYMAEYLTAAGHHVELAASTNQEGWDAIVDGQLINFKSGVGADHIQDHIERFPDIPVITVAEQAEVFADSGMVTCLEGVSGAEIGRVTEDAMGSVVELGDFGVEIPLITLAISATKNIKPVWKGHSSLGTAAVNITADTAGVGFGGAAGAKAGAMMGATGGPVGMVAGGILGGVAGAIGGRFFAKQFKEKALREAVSVYNSEVIGYGHAYIGALQVKAGSLQNTAQLWRRPFSLWRFIRPVPSDVIRGDMRTAYMNWARHCRASANELLTQAAVPEHEKANAYFRLGTKLLQKGHDEPVYHSQVEGRLKRIRNSIDRIKAEKLRLGYSI